MGRTRFRKSFKVAPGVKINLNKKSVGVTIGGKGARYTVNTSGQRTLSTGIPGTGLYFVETSKKKGSSKGKKGNGGTGESSGSASEDENKPLFFNHYTGGCPTGCPNYTGYSCDTYLSLYL